jgi:hypothetical protein
MSELHGDLIEREFRCFAGASMTRAGGVFGDFAELGPLDADLRRTTSWHSERAAHVPIGECSHTWAKMDSVS